MPDNKNKKEEEQKKVSAQIPVSTYKKMMHKIIDESASTNISDYVSKLILDDVEKSDKQ